MVIGINHYEQEAARYFREEMGATKIMNAGEFKCKACGRCCTEEPEIPLTFTDIFRISKHLGMTPEAFYNKYLTLIDAGICVDYKPEKGKHGFGFKMDLAGGHSCPFMVDHKCSIHAVKPLICKVYPYNDIRLFRGDAVKSLVTLHKDCSIIDLADDQYIILDLEAIYQLHLGILMMAEYTEAFGNKFIPRAVDNLYHKEMAMAKNRKHAADRDELVRDEFLDMMDFVERVRIREADGKKLFEKRIMFPDGGQQ